ncbi:MAG TPA: universal stress protein [Polyangiales bacterium]|nr:universal stress protein [Polyangiales bacterium]
METVRQLVLGTDFSECADQALALALQLAAASLARLTVVHVCEPDAEEQVVLERSETLSTLVAGHGCAGVEINAVLRSGVPWKKLDNVAAEVGAVLIVIGRHGSGRSAGLGTVADQLIRYAHRSVLTVACDFSCLSGEAFAIKQQ